MPTPICVTTVLAAGIGTTRNPLSTIMAPPARSTCRVLSDVVARRSDDEVGLVVEIDRVRLVPCNRPDTEAPKKLGVLAGELGVVSTN